MAISLTVRRFCLETARLLPRVESRNLLHTQSQTRLVPSCIHHRPLCPPAFHSGAICVLRPGNSASKSFHICQRNIFTKWLRTSSSSSKNTKDSEIASKDLDSMEEDSIIPKTDEEGKPLSNWKRMKIMMKAYGYVIIPVHWVIAPLWFGAFYYTIKMGVDIGPFLTKIGVSDHHVETLRNSKASTALMAYALYKIFTPLRYTVTLGATEVTIRKLRKLGYMKPTPPKEKTYRDSFKETVGEMKDKISDMRETKNS
ncbi:protein FAM210A-like [Lytechinus pictus]|uniref:protein FAM210A-like n=1 Tax=Lytechinus pictus TaxID=7653 RepID=UPI0030BA072E